MIYGFILGRVYTLSLAELFEVLKNLGVTYTIRICGPEIVVLETDKALDHESLQKRLGGTIKIIRLFDTFQKKGKEYPSTVLETYFNFKRINTQYFSQYTGKKQFGVSVYNVDPSVRYREEPRRIAFLIKKILQSEKQSVRAVIPEFPQQALSSVQVNENHILEKGAEIAVITGNQRMFVGKTLTVQNYEDYGRRDYQRPARDEKAGMIPPKVAQVMVNLAGKLKPLDYVLDPFCGSGTLLQEALLLGYRVIGSDLDPHAIENSNVNLEWFKNRYRVSPGRFKVLLSHAAELSANLPKVPYSAIVTEGTLGPIYGKLPKKSDMKTNFEDLARLYGQVFSEYSKILPKAARIVMCFPAYKLGQDTYEFMPSLDFALQNGYNILAPIPQQTKAKYKFLKVTDRDSLVYDRKDQVVAREIIIFSKVNPEVSSDPNLRMHPNDTNDSPASPKTASRGGDNSDEDSEHSDRDLVKEQTSGT